MASSMLEKPLSMIYKSELRNKIMKGYKPASAKLKRRKTKSTKRNKYDLNLPIITDRSLNKVSLKDKDEFIFQTASSCSRLQYLNKTFAEFKSSDFKLNTKSTHQKNSSNILKYKKYIQPLNSFQKYDRRVASPISITIQGKLCKNTKGSADFVGKHKKTSSSRKIVNPNLNSIDLVNSSSFHNSSSVTGYKQIKMPIKLNPKKIGNMSILDKPKQMNMSSAHHKKKNTLTGFNKLNFLASPRLSKKTHLMPSSRMEVINLTKDQAIRAKKIKNKKLYSSAIPNENIIIKKPKLIKTQNRSKDMSNVGSFEDSLTHPIKLSSAYQIKPKLSRKKTNIMTAKFKTITGLSNYTPVDTSKSRKSSRKHEPSQNSMYVYICLIFALYQVRDVTFFII